MDIGALSLDLNERTTTQRSVNHVLVDSGVIDGIPREQDMPLVAFRAEVPRGTWNSLICVASLDANVVDENGMRMAIRLVLKEHDGVGSRGFEGPHGPRSKCAHWNLKAGPSCS